MLSDIMIINLDRVLKVLKKIKIGDDNPNRAGTPIKLLAEKLNISDEEMGEIVPILISNRYIEYLHPDMKLNVLITEKGIEFITKSAFSKKALQKEMKKAREEELDRRDAQRLAISKRSLFISILAIIISIVALFKDYIYSYIQ